MAFTLARLKNERGFGGKVNCRLKWTVGIEDERQLESIELSRNNCQPERKQGKLVQFLILFKKNNIV